MVDFVSVGCILSINGPGVAATLGFTIVAIFLPILGTESVYGTPAVGRLISSISSSSSS